MGDTEEYVCTLSKETQLKAARELNETPETRIKALKMFRRHVKDYPGLMSPTEDRFLLKFLRARKFDVDRALALLINYFRKRNEFVSDVYKDYRPSAVADVIQRRIVTVLPVSDEKGRRIILYRPGLWDPKDAPYMALTRTLLMSCELLLDIDEATQVNGIVFIIDYANVGLWFLPYVTSEYFRTVTRIVQEGLPARMKEVHYVNETDIIGYIFPILKPYIESKYLERIHFHGQTFDGLHEFLPKHILPPEYGGTYETCISKDWTNTFLECEDRFVKMEKYELIEDIPSIKGDDIKDVAPQKMLDVD